MIEKINVNLYTKNNFNKYTQKNNQETVQTSFQKQPTKMPVASSNLLHLIL